MIHILEIHPRVHGGSRLILKWNLNNKRTPKQQAAKYKYILNLTVLYCAVLYKTWLPAEMHQPSFWSHSSFPWVNNLWSSRKQSYEYYWWYTWGYLLVSRKQMNSFRAEMYSITTLCFMLLSESLHRLITKLQILLIRIKFLIMVSRCKCT